ncbi:MAG: farnesyl diphosphate synthase [Methylomonas sp.]|jgi:farnesyl diphosphate synthase
MSNILKAYFTACQERVELALDARLPDPHRLPQKLHQAMRYSVLGGGKRTRPILCYATGQALGMEESKLDAIACAVEFIHVYSLIHDDLPAMDDDDLRRGKPTCHKAFDEATAILAGDALQALAFEVLGADSGIGADSATRLKMIETLAKACGAQGMVGGQAIDLDSVGTELTLPELENMHIHKTGALIRASVNLAAYCQAGLDPAIGKHLDSYAKCIGLSFQVKDDILDVESDTETLGKTQGKDGDHDKPTYPALLGLAGAKQKALELHELAVTSLSCFGNEADLLREISLYIIERTH